MSLELSRRLVGDVTVITCTGRIVLGKESESLQACLDETLPMNTHVLLHLAGVEFVDSGGLGLLVRYLTRAQNAGGAPKLCALSSKVDECSEDYSPQAGVPDLRNRGRVDCRRPWRARSRVLCRAAPTSSAWTRPWMDPPICASCSNNRATGFSRRPICPTL